MQCPAGYVAIPAVVALGAILGRKVALAPQQRTDWREVANIWGLIVGWPGAMKTPAADEGLKFSKRLDAEANKANEATEKAHANDMALAKIRNDEALNSARAAIKGGGGAPAGFDLSTPEKPPIKRYIVSDTSYEALGEILADNPNGVLAHRDELVALLRTLDREDNAAARGFFLTAWSGTSGYTFDRIVRGRKHIPAACLSIVGGTQPGRMPNTCGAPMRAALTTTALFSGSVCWCGRINRQNGGRWIASPTPKRATRHGIRSSISTS